MSANPNKLLVFETIQSAWKKTKGSKGPLWGVITCSAMTFLIIEVIKWFIYTPEDEFIQPLTWAYIGVSFIWFLSVVYFYFKWALLYLGVLSAMDERIRFNMIKYVMSLKTLLRMLGLSAFLFLLLLPAFLLATIPLVIPLNEKYYTYHLIGYVINSPDPLLVITTYLKSYSVVGIVSTVSPFLLGVGLFCYFIMRAAFAQQLIIVKKYNPWKALRISFRATRSNVWRLFGFFLLSSSIVLLSAIPLGIGLIWSLPFVCIAWGEAYRRLTLEEKIVIKILPNKRS